MFRTYGVELKIVKGDVVLSQVSAGEEWDIYLSPQEALAAARWINRTVKEVADED